MAGTAKFKVWQHQVYHTCILSYAQDVQIAAKKKMQQNISLFQAFPTREKDLNVTKSCIMKTLAEFEADGRMVKDGELDLIHNSWVLFSLFFRI